MIQKYDADDYFATMSVTIVKPNLVIISVEIPIDESESIAYDENGRTMKSEYMGTLITSMLDVESKKRPSAEVIIVL